MSSHLLWCSHKMPLDLWNQNDSPNSLWGCCEIFYKYSCFNCLFPNEILFKQLLNKKNALHDLGKTTDYVITS